ncbi:MAG: THUMP domain-containing protein [Myxococcaceae bacterium]
MPGWVVPPPKEPEKGDDDFRRERERKVRELLARGLLRSEWIREALLKVPRERFIPRRYRDYAYQEVPIPLPGVQSSISCPHSYPLFYEPLALGRGHRFLEVGLGSGYGAALAREIVGDEGLVVSLEIDPQTFAFARAALRRAGYTDVVPLLRDGGLGCPEHAPYDRICLTAACEEIPPPLLAQLKVGGKLIAPVARGETQELVLFEKWPDGVRRTTVCEVLYVRLRGRYGAAPSPPVPPARLSPEPQTRQAPCLVVTCAGLYGGGQTRRALRRAAPGGRVRGSGFRGVVLLESAEDCLQLAERVTRECSDAIGRAVPVLAEVPSDLEALREAAARIGADQVGEGESFAFRLHKRGAHGYREPTRELEREVGSAIWTALEQKHGAAPKVELVTPDVTIVAEVFGPVSRIGVLRKAWRAARQGR